MTKRSDTITPNFFPKESMPLSALQERFMNHKRLRVFATKGCVCANCGVVGTQLILHEDRGRRRHIDLYTADMVLMTVDHINPKANGGSEHIDNLQPMCTNCNRRKSDKVPPGTVFLPSQVAGTPESEVDAYLAHDGMLFDRSFQRPREFFRLNASEQWEIDKWLGLLDWEGGCHHRHYRMCNACFAKYNEYYD